VTDTRVPDGLLEQVVSGRPVAGVYPTALEWRLAVEVRALRRQVECLAGVAESRLH